MKMPCRCRAVIRSTSPSVIPSVPTNETLHSDSSLSLIKMPTPAQKHRVDNFYQSVN